MRALSFLAWSTRAPPEPLPDREDDFLEPSAPRRLAGDVFPRCAWHSAGRWIPPLRRGDTAHLGKRRPGQPPGSATIKGCPGLFAARALRACAGLLDAVEDQVGRLRGHFGRLDGAGAGEDAEFLFREGRSRQRLSDRGNRLGKRAGRFVPCAGLGPKPHRSRTAGTDQPHRKHRDSPRGVCRAVARLAADTRRYAPA